MRSGGTQRGSRDDSEALLRSSLAMLAAVLTAAAFVLAAGALEAFTAYL